MQRVSVEDWKGMFKVNALSIIPLIPNDSVGVKMLRSSNRFAVGERSSSLW